MAKPDAAAVANILRELGQRMELERRDPYRARAYARAAENLSLTLEPLDSLIKEGRLTEIPAIGDRIAAVITRIHHTGHHSGLDEVRQKVPASVLEMLRIPGLKPERVRKLHIELGIHSLAALEEAARTDRLKALKGYGPAFQAKVLKGIEMSRLPQGRHLHRAAAATAYASDEIARVHPDWTDITPAGDFRRGCELVSDLALVAVDPRRLGDTDIMTNGGLTIHAAAPARYGIALLLATGSAQHVEALTKVAQQKGMTLDAKGLHKNTRIVAHATEQNIYNALGLSFIPPELRETGDEVRLALEGNLPILVTQDDLHGVLHAHTTESDGADTLKDMADATRERGYAYLGLTDHSQTAHYAGGLKPREVLAQKEENRQTQQPHES